MDLKLYNPDAVCPKCGSGEIGKEYIERHIENDDMECLRRTCKCGFNWHEHCADYGTKEIEQTTSTSCSIEHTYVKKD